MVGLEVNQPKLKQPELAQLIIDCQQQQANNEDGRPCLELARRGLTENDGDAWTAFETQFTALFHLWIHQEAAYHGLSALDSDSMDELWADARGRFVSRYGVDGRFTQRFVHLGALLKTLRLCIRSTLQDQARQREQHHRLSTALTPIATQDTTLPDAQIEADELRNCVQSQIMQDVPEEELRRLIEYRYDLDLKPREIQSHLPELFATVNEVHRALEKVMKRLRRRMEIYLERCL